MRDHALVAIMVLLAALASPMVLAAKPPRTTTDSPAPPAAASKAAGNAGLIGFMGAVSVGMLGLGALAAYRSTRPRNRRPPRRSFESGRRLGRAAGAQSTADAAARIAKSDELKGVNVATHGAGLRVVGMARRGRPCDHVAGYLTGVLEAAWAADVAVAHETCGARAGQACVFDVMPARGARSGPAFRPTFSGSALPTEGSPTPGSSDGRRRSRRARSGGD